MENISTIRRKTVIQQEKRQLIKVELSQNPERSKRALSGKLGVGDCRIRELFL